MKNDVFNGYVEMQIENCRNMLVRKSDYGSQEDRLHNFQAFADLAGVSLEQVCGGYLGKHLVSVYDLIKKTENGEPTDLDVWDEKITDSINYFIILSAIVHGRMGVIPYDDREFNPDDDMVYVDKLFTKKTPAGKLVSEDSINWRLETIDETYGGFAK